MYEELIKTAKICCGDVSKEDCAAVCIDPHDKRGEDVRFCRQWLIKDLYTALSALQSENGSKDKEIEQLRLQRPVQVDGNVMALALELAETKAALTRVEAERDTTIHLLDDVWEMLDPDGPEGGYGEAATNMVAYLIYDKIRDYRHRFGAQGEG